MDSTFNYYLDEERALEICASAATEYCKWQKSIGHIDEQTCITNAYDSVRSYYYISNGIKSTKSMSAEELRKLDAPLERLSGRIAEIARKTAVKYAVNLQALDIKKASASAIIKEAMDEAGYKVGYIDCQCYRAKVYVTLSNRYRLTAIIKYKDILAGKMPEIMEEYKKFIEELQSLPFEVKVCK